MYSSGVCEAGRGQLLLWTLPFKLAVTFLLLPTARRACSARSLRGRTGDKQLCVDWLVFLVFLARRVALSRSRLPWARLPLALAWLPHNQKCCGAQFGHDVSWTADAGEFMSAAMLFERRHAKWLRPGLVHKYVGIFYFFLKKRLKIHGNNLICVEPYVQAI